MRDYVVSGWRDGFVVRQWFVSATSADEACTIAERSQAGIADFDRFSAEVTGA
jgi:hypothetical protein